MCFVAVPPVLKQFPYPLLKFDATLKQIQDYEAKNDYKLIQETEVNGNKVYTFNKKREVKEYSEMFAHRYIMKDGKLLQVTVIISPYAYVMPQILGGGFLVSDAFVAMMKNDGYTKENKNEVVDGKKISYSVYTNAASGNKFTLEAWRINLNGHKKVGAAGINFVPADGPDKLPL